jgi:hypothetical protein
MKLNLLLLSAALLNAATATQAVNAYADTDMDPGDDVVSSYAEKESYYLPTSPLRFLQDPVGMQLTTTQTVELGTAATYTILAKSGISNVPLSYISGNIAVSPIAASAITGFGLLLAADGQSSTASQVIGGGKAFAASYGGAIATALTVAVGDMEIAYADAAGRVNNDPTRINVGQGAIGGLTLTPGVYTFQTGVSIGTGTKVTFDAQGDSDAVFIIQMTGNLWQAASTGVILAKNIFWQVAGNVLVGAYSHLAGVLLVKTGVTFMTESFLDGRILAQTACTLQKARIQQGPKEGPSTSPKPAASSKERALATATVKVTATTTDPFTNTETTKITTITQTTEVTALETRKTTKTTHITKAKSGGEGEESKEILPDIVVVSAGSGAAAPAAMAVATAVEGKAPFLASATSTATATASLSGSAYATAAAESIAGPASTATSTATTTATRTTTNAEAFADATKTDNDILPTATATTTGTTEANAVALGTKTATSTATATFTEA